jgi:hypothetical protein
VASFGAKINGKANLQIESRTCESINSLKQQTPHKAAQADGERSKHELQNYEPLRNAALGRRRGLNLLRLTESKAP